MQLNEHSTVAIASVNYVRFAYVFRKLSALYMHEFLDQEFKHCLWLGLMS